MVSLAIIFSIFDLQYNQGDYWESESKKMNFRYDPVKASRGNILSDDGSILATSLPFYKVALDPSIPDKRILEDGIDSLSLLLSSFFNDKSKNEYKKLILSARENEREYLLLNGEKIGYQDKKKCLNGPFLEWEDLKEASYLKKWKKDIGLFPNWDIEQLVL